MKKRFYDVGTLLYVRNQKCTTGLIVGSIVAAVGAIGAAGINAASQSSANSANMQLNEKTLEEQKKLFHEANQFNHDEANIARNFNAEQAGISRDFNAEQAQINREFQAGQLEKIMDYQTPSKQVQRYLQAGLNPASLAGNINAGGFSVPSGSAGSSSPANGSAASSSGVPQLPVTHVNPVDYGQIGKALTDGVSNVISNSSSVEDYKSKVTFNKYYDEIQKAGLDVSRQQARVLWNQYNEISQNIALARKSVDKLVSDIGLQEKQGQWYDKSGALIKEQEIGYHIDNAFKSEHWQNIIKREAAEAGLTELQTKWYTSFIKSQIAMNFGSAAYSKALTELTNVEREFKSKGMEDELNVLKETRNYYEDSNKLLGIELEVAGKTKGKRVEEEIKSLEWKNSVWMRGSEFLKNVIQPIAIGAGLYLGAKGMKGAGSATVKGPTIFTNSPKGSVPGLDW